MIKKTITKIRAHQNYFHRQVCINICGTFYIRKITREQEIEKLNSSNSGGHIKCEIIGGKKYLKDLEQGGLEIPARLTISNTNKKMRDAMQEKLNPLVEEYRRINSKPK